MHTHTRARHVVAGYDFSNTSAAGLNMYTYYNDTVFIAGSQPDRLLRIPGLISNAVVAWWKHYTGTARA